jgi:mono/diheme cytochrome c family protein
MKNIIVGLLTVVIIGLMGYTFMGGGAYHGGEYGKVIEDFGDSMTAAKTVVVAEKSDREKEDDKLSALRDKAGSAGAFQVSNEYKSKCASCHGVNGSGMQNGKAMMGKKREYRYEGSFNSIE